MKGNKVLIVLGILSAISVFLPWVEATSSASIGEYSANYSSGAMMGYSFGGGILGLLLSIVSILLASRKQRWTIIVGVANLLIGLTHILGWVGSSNQANYNSDFGVGSVQAGIEPLFGLYLFTVVSVMLIIFSIKKEKGRG